MVYVCEINSHPDKEEVTDQCRANVTSTGMAEEIQKHTFVQHGVYWIRRKIFPF